MIWDQGGLWYGSDSIFLNPISAAVTTKIYLRVQALKFPLIIYCCKFTWIQTVENVVWDVCQALTETWHAGSHSATFPRDVWCSRENCSGLPMTKVYICSDDFNNWSLLLDVSSDTLSFSHIQFLIKTASRSQCEQCESWQSALVCTAPCPIQIYERDCRVKCRTGTSRPPWVCQGINLSLQPMKRSLFWGMRPSLPPRGLRAAPDLGPN